MTVWAAVSSRSTFETFFLRDTVTFKWYVQILHVFVAIENTLIYSSATFWFMQDGARPHRIAYVFSFLGESLDNWINALNYLCFTGKGIDWPQYSPDLHPCDFFLWGTSKDAVYRKNSRTLEQVEEIERTLSCFIDHFIENVSQFRPPITICAAEGAHLENNELWFSFIKRFQAFVQ